jgi:hypothetical protein
VSPALLSQATAGLGGGGGLEHQPAGPSLAQSRQRIRDYLERSLIRQLTNNAIAAGLAIDGVRLLPMRLHDNYQEFRDIMGAWTNSSHDIYLNFEAVLGVELEAALDPFVATSAVSAFLSESRAILLRTLFHEMEHVRQFLTNNDSPPTSFGQMIGFEVEAYGNTLSWLTSGQGRRRLEELGATRDTIDQWVSESQGTQQDFVTWDSELSTEPERKETLVTNGLLPQALQGYVNYVVEDLYRTAPPPAQ